MCGWGRRFAAPSHTKSPSSLRVFERSEASAAVGSTVRRTGGVEGGGGVLSGAWPAWRRFVWEFLPAVSGFAATGCPVDESLFRTGCNG